MSFSFVLSEHRDINFIIYLFLRFSFVLSEHRDKNLYREPFFDIVGTLGFLFCPGIPTTRYSEKVGTPVCRNNDMSKQWDDP